VLLIDDDLHVRAAVQPGGDGDGRQGVCHDLRLWGRDEQSDGNLLKITYPIFVVAMTATGAGGNGSTVGLAEKRAPASPVYVPHSPAGKVAGDVYCFSIFTGCVGKSLGVLQVQLYGWYFGKSEACSDYFCATFSPVVALPSKAP